MAILKNQIVISHEIREWKGEDGELIKKHKYIFLNEDGSKSVGWDENGIYATDIQNVDKFDSSLAKRYPWDIREYQGVFTEKLASGQKKFSDDVRKK